VKLLHLTLFPAKLFTSLQQLHLPFLYMDAARRHPNRNLDKILYSKQFLPKVHRNFGFQSAPRMKPLDVTVLVAFKRIGFEVQNQIDTGIFVFTVSSKPALNSASF